MRNCPSCGLASQIHIFELPVNCRAKVSRANYDFSLCKRCETVFISSDVTTEDLQAQYDNEIQFDSGVYREAARVTSILEYYGIVLRQMSELMAVPIERMNILEVGSGLAWMCRCAKMASPLAVTVAQDLSNECVNECTWVDKYIVGHIDNEEVRCKGPFDLVSMTHVIEHVPNPVLSIGTISTLLSANGRLYVTAPHRPENWGIDQDRETWRMWAYNYVPGHLQYFSKEAMELVGKKCGLKMERWTLCENGQSFEAVFCRQ